MKFVHLPENLWASQIRWSHAVNSREKLSLALAPNSDCNFIEADVFGAECFMAHPPAQTSDIKFDAWFSSILEHNFRCHERKQSGSLQGENISPKGVKIDFKAPECVSLCFDIIQSQLKAYSHRNSYLSFQLALWLNADILQGPNGHPPLFEPLEFVLQCLNSFPDSTLSLGWTTGKGFFRPGQQVYTTSMISSMMDILQTIPASQGPKQITFPVRCDLFLYSYPLFEERLATTPGLSLTVWGSLQYYQDAKKNINQDFYHQFLARFRNLLYFDLTWG
eukprot:Sdes_comp18674_c0_seq1m8921